MPSSHEIVTVPSILSATVHDWSDEVVVEVPSGPDTVNVPSPFATVEHDCDVAEVPSGQATHHRQSR